MPLPDIFFWFAFSLLAWTFAGYPLAVMCLSRLRPKPWRTAPFHGTVSMIIAAHNEEDVIRDKVENCLSLDFGPADAEILVVNDGSTDGTNAILGHFSGAASRLRVVTYQPRAGKANALNVGVSLARGDVLIFSDANVMVDPTSCQSLLAPFADPAVGVVCGRVLVRPRGDQEVAGESLYMKYEGLVHRSEALWYSMVGVDGALFAMCRELFRPLPTGIILDDFLLSMQAPMAGLRVVYQSEATAIEEAIPSARNESKRKARIVAGGYQFLADFWRSGRSLQPAVWFAFVSHKILRWVAPLLLLTLLVANLFLLDTVFYRWLLAGQCLFYSIAVLGYLSRHLRKNHIVYLPYYFTVVNLAALRGLVRFLSLKQHVLWDKVDR